MPTISLFYGIQIFMYFYDNEQHSLPHIHAKYQENTASFSIIDGEILSGTFPKKQTRLVQAWIEIYRDSLIVDWELATSGQEPLRIEPLK